jgi:hypothetical protein
MMLKPQQLPEQSETFSFRLFLVCAKLVFCAQ